MRSRGSFLVLSAVLAALVAPGVTQARVPGIGNGVRIDTVGPDLVSAQIANAAGPKLVDFCFDSQVSETTAASFLVVGYDSARSLTAGSAEILPGAGQTCVRARFADGANLLEGSIGALVDGAARGPDGSFSAASSEPLGGSALSPIAGRTTGPDLVSVVADDFDIPPDPDGGTLASGGTLTFSFDEPLNPGHTPNPANFGWFDGQGNPADRAGNYIPEDGVDRAAGTVRVAVDQTSAGVSPSSAATYFTLAGAVQDTPASQNSEGGPLATPSAPDAVQPSAGALPVLVAAAGGPRRWTLTYSGEVNAVMSRRTLRAVLDDGTLVAPNADVETIDGSLNQVVVTFGANVGSDASAIARIVDPGGGVVSRAPLNPASAPGSVAAGTPVARPGLTNGPDLLSTSVDLRSQSVTYRFDEDVAVVTPAQFFIAAASAGISGPSGSSVELDDTVNVVFGATARTAVGAGVKFGAVRDELGNRSPESVVSFALEQPPGSAPAVPDTGPAPAPPVTTGPLPPAPSAGGPPKGRFSTTLVLRRQVRQLRGRLTSAGRGCRAFRRVDLKQRVGGRVRLIRRIETAGDGTFRLTVSRRFRGRSLYVHIAQREGSSAVCGSVLTRRFLVPRRG